MSRPVGGVLSGPHRSAALGSHPSARSTWTSRHRSAGGRAARLVRFDLAPGGVCRAAQSPGRWCALTAPFHPCLIPPPERQAIGGLLSVALSCESPRLAVSQHPALWSPDLPQPGHPANRTSEPRLPSRLTVAGQSRRRGQIADSAQSAPLTGGATRRSTPTTHTSAGYRHGTDEMGPCARENPRSARGGAWGISKDRLKGC